MSQDVRVEQLLERLLAETPTSRAPDRLRADIACATSRKRQRPPWLTNLKEPSMRYRSQLVVGSPTLRLAAVVAVTALLTLALAGAVIAGASPQPSPAPLPPASPTWVTGTQQPVEDSCDTGPVTSDGGVTRSAYECAYTWTSSDPRLTGDVSVPWIEDTYQTDDGVIAIGMNASYLQNEGGGWACSSEYVSQGATPALSLHDDTSTCHGSGGYEGLTAVLITTPKTDSFANDFVGLIFAGDLPPVPEPPTE
jgi:hypothetical protein